MTSRCEQNPGMCCGDPQCPDKHCPGHPRNAEAAIRSDPRGVEAALPIVTDELSEVADIWTAITGMFAAAIIAGLVIGAVLWLVFYVGPVLYAVWPINH